MLVALESVAVVVALVTCTVLPVVAHPLVVSEISVVSGAVPPVDSGGSKVMDPVTWLQVMVPAAIVPPGCVVGVGAAAVVEVVGGAADG
ncbi:MAG TPA: hypothetical protein VED63_02845 [Acidimicrobiales bacterium]|nr:hypothetical protein [Acidimicrobiales bacterium]